VVAQNRKGISAATFFLMIAADEDGETGYSEYAALSGGISKGESATYSYSCPYSCSCSCSCSGTALTVNAGCRV
jgi:hypothetical protein